MRLKNPVTIIPPSIKLPDGSEKKFNPIVLDELKLTILDDSNKKTVEVRIELFPYSIVLWTGYFYDKAGDYTQKDIENKILETLGKDPEKVLTELFKHMVYATNFIPSVSAIHLSNHIPISSRNVFSTFYTEFSANSAYRANPYTFLMGISSIRPSISSLFVRQPRLTTHHLSLSAEMRPFTTSLSSISGI
jgi:hypothetical protein